MASPSMREEVRVLRQGCALLQDSRLSRLTLSGEDRLRFLNGLVTCDVRALGLGQGVYGFFTDVKGHILADVVVRSGEELLWLELPVSAVEGITSHLTKYNLADRVDIHPSKQSLAVTVAGPRAPEVLRSVCGEDVPDGFWSHRRATIAGHQVEMARDERVGVSAYGLWVDAAAARALVETLRAPNGPIGLVSASQAAADVVRVEERIPRFGIDFGPDNLPQETGLEEAVSYTKGCYLGQEVVARLHYRGHAAQRICALRFDGEEPPPFGTAILFEERPAGRVTSAVRSPEAGLIVGLAMLQRRACEPGTSLACESGCNAVVS